MARTLKIDFVSDVMCPWCIVGLGGLEEALRRLDGVVSADIQFQPFELNPAMPPEGQNIVEHIGQKYGSTPEQSASNRAMIHARAAEVGFDMRTGPESRIWNTFDVHRLLFWAGMEGRQHALKHAMFDAHFTDGLNMSDHEVLADTAQKADLDRDAAADVLSSGRYGPEVRAEEQVWQARGITSVPAVVIDDRYLISGGQPVDVFEQALRTIAAEADTRPA
jgi:predicted DsbA family dithiol-disulfide isomerase